MYGHMRVWSGSCDPTTHGHVRVWSGSCDSTMHGHVRVWSGSCDHTMHSHMRACDPNFDSSCQWLGSWSQIICTVCSGNFCQGQTFVRQSMNWAKCKPSITGKETRLCSVGVGSENHQQRLRLFSQHLK